MKGLATILIAGSVVTVVAISIGFGVADMGTVALVTVLTAIILTVCWQAGTERDPWFWWVATLAFVAKLAGSALRYWVLVVEYERVGDATGYHGWGSRIAETWRAFKIPSLDGSMGVGTQVVRWITSLLYAPYQPTMLGGFFMFATLAFLGQLLFYCAFRRAVPGARLGIYAGFIFFLPAMVFWPSSIGKESLMILFLGFASYGMARAFVGYAPLWLVVGGAGLAAAGMIRPHIAALTAASFAGSALLGRGTWQGKAAAGRVIVLGIGALLTVVAVSTFSDRYEIGEPDDLDPFISDVGQRTQQGGSAVEGEAVRSPSALPGGALRVLFRPLPHEAHNLQAMANALENTALLAIVIWKTPAMVKRIRRIRIPYVMMSAAFTVGFVVAFSTFLNLGILARQRSQVLPYLLAVLVALGWDSRDRFAGTPQQAGRHLAADPLDRDVTEQSNHTRLRSGRHLPVS